MVQVIANGGNNVDIGANGVTVNKIDAGALRDNISAQSFVNDDDETVRYYHLATNKYYLVNTSGAVQKSKVAAKDGDDWYFYVKNRAVKLYSNNKNWDDRSTNVHEDWEDYLTQAQMDLAN